MPNRPLLNLVALALICTGCASSRPSADAPLSAITPPADDRRTFDPDEVHNQSGRRTMGREPRAAMAMAALSGSEPTTGEMAAHFINVGQGDATLLEFSCGAILIDTGGETNPETIGADMLAAYLDTFFARRSDLNRTLDLVVLSHPHKDHTEGIRVFLDGHGEPTLPGGTITIRNVVDNGVDSGHSSGISGQRALQDYARNQGAGYDGIENGEILFLDGLTSNVIDPVACNDVDPVIRAGWGREAFEWSTNMNNHSVVLRVDFGETSFLFTGDVETEAMKAMLESYEDDLSIFDVDVLKVAHHGSKNGLTAAFLAAVSPAVAVIQAGDHDLSHADFSAHSFGHPNKIAVGLLADSAHAVSESRSPLFVDVGVRGRNPSTGAPPAFETILLERGAYSTAWDGTIVIYARQNGTLRIETENE